MKGYIGVIDYGMGNLRSVEKALESVGAKVKIVRSPADVRKSRAIVLPGVGAFGQAADRLKSQGLTGVIQEALLARKPFLGICLGLQLLFEKSEESPRAKGLGFLKGSVIKFRTRVRKELKVPHMGWNTVQINRHRKSPLLQGIHGGEYFYFVHSYYPEPKDGGVVATRTHYGEPFCSSVASDALFACQFHPEKSGEKGLGILRNFVKWSASC